MAALSQPVRYLNTKESDGYGWNGTRMAARAYACVCARSGCGWLRPRDAPFPLALHSQ